MAKAFEWNERKFVEVHGHKPLFSLTPEGARALSEFLAEAGEDETKFVNPETLANFLGERMKISSDSKNPLSRDSICKLFGLALPVQQEQADKVEIDYDLLAFIADPKKNAERPYRPGGREL